MDILYKYVSAQRVSTCVPEVGDGTLRATQPASLNDPFECAVRPTYVYDDETDENRELARVLTEINGSHPVHEDDILRARHEYGSMFTRHLITQQLSTKFGIVSFSTHSRHPLLWSHYTSDGSGFAIGYDVAKLVKICGVEEYLRPVNYVKKLPWLLGPLVLVSPESNLPIFLSTKSYHWSYEDEWRLIVKLDQTIGTGKTDQHGQPINLIRVPNEAVVSVFYTERTPHDMVSMIRDRLATPNNRYGTIEPRKLVLSSESYDYEEME